jgi:hypothetical protein
MVVSMAVLSVVAMAVSLAGQWVDSMAVLSVVSMVEMMVEMTVGL